MSDNSDRRINSNISNHIFPASANLLGVCFLIFSLVRTFGKSQSTFLDELAVIGIYFFLISAILSYLSLRSNSKSKRLEKAADLIFILGLILLAIVSTILTLEIIL